MLIRVRLDPSAGPPLSDEELAVPFRVVLFEFFVGLVPVTILIVATLGSIMTGFATRMEGPALGCLGAVLVALAYRKHSLTSASSKKPFSARPRQMDCRLISYGLQS